MHKKKSSLWVWEKNMENIMFEKKEIKNNGGIFEKKTKWVIESGY